MGESANRRRRRGDRGAVATAGTYLVIVATFDPGYDGEGTYLLTVLHAPPP